MAPLEKCTVPERTMNESRSCLCSTSACSRNMRPAAARLALGMDGRIGPLCRGTSSAGVGPLAVLVLAAYSRASHAGGNMAATARHRVIVRRCSGVTIRWCEMCCMRSLCGGAKFGRCRYSALPSLLFSASSAFSTWPLRAFIHPLCWKSQPRHPSSIRT